MRKFLPIFLTLLLCYFVTLSLVKANHRCAGYEGGDGVCDQYTEEGVCTHGCYAGGDPNPSYHQDTENYADNGPADRQAEIDRAAAEAANRAAEAAKAAQQSAAAVEAARDAERKRAADAAATRVDQIIKNTNDVKTAINAAGDDQTKIDIARGVGQCDGWADNGSEHRNAGNGCFYTCENGSWKGPNKCDGQGNGLFQYKEVDGKPSQSFLDLSPQQIADEVAKRQWEAYKFTLKQDGKVLVEDGKGGYLTNTDGTYQTKPDPKPDPNLKTTAQIAEETAGQRAAEVTIQQKMAVVEYQAKVADAMRETNETVKNQMLAEYALLYQSVPEAQTALANLNATVVNDVKARLTKEGKNAIGVTPGDKTESGGATSICKMNDNGGGFLGWVPCDDSQTISDKTLIGTSAQFYALRYGLVLETDDLKDPAKLKAKLAKVSAARTNGLNITSSAKLDLVGSDGKPLVMDFEKIAKEQQQYRGAFCGACGGFIADNTGGGCSEQINVRKNANQCDDTLPVICKNPDGSLCNLIDNIPVLGTRFNNGKLEVHINSPFGGEWTNDLIKVQASLTNSADDDKRLLEVIKTPVEKEVKRQEQLLSDVVKIIKNCGEEKDCTQKAQDQLAQVSPLLRDSGLATELYRNGVDLDKAASMLGITEGAKNNLDTKISALKNSYENQLALIDQYSKCGNSSDCDKILEKIDPGYHKSATEKKIEYEKYTVQRRENIDIIATQLANLDREQANLTDAEYNSRYSQIRNQNGVDNEMVRLAAEKSGQINKDVDNFLKCRGSNCSLPSTLSSNQQDYYKAQRVQLIAQEALEAYQYRNSFQGGAELLSLRKKELTYASPELSNTLDETIIKDQLTQEAKDYLRKNPKVTSFDLSQISDSPTYVYFKDKITANLQKNIENQISEFISTQKTISKLEKVAENTRPECSSNEYRKNNPSAYESLCGYRDELLLDATKDYSADEIKKLQLAALSNAAQGSNMNNYQIKLAIADLAKANNTNDTDIRAQISKELLVKTGMNVEQLMEFKDIKENNGWVNFLSLADPTGETVNTRIKQNVLISNPEAKQKDLKEIENYVTDRLGAFGKSFTLASMSSEEEKKAVEGAVLALNFVSVGTVRKFNDIQNQAINTFSIDNKVKDLETPLFKVNSSDISNLQLLGQVYSYATKPELLLSKLASATLLNNETDKQNLKTELKYTRAIVGQGAIPAALAVSVAAAPIAATMFPTITLAGGLTLGQTAVGIAAATHSLGSTAEHCTFEKDMNGGACALSAANSAFMIATAAVGVANNVSGFNQMLALTKITPTTNFTVGTLTKVSNTAIETGARAISPPTTLTQIGKLVDIGGVGVFGANTINACQSHEGQQTDWVGCGFNAAMFTMSVTRTLSGSLGRLASNNQKIAGALNSTQSKLGYADFGLNTVQATTACASAIKTGDINSCITNAGFLVSSYGHIKNIHDLQSEVNKPNHNSKDLITKIASATDTDKPALVTQLKEAIKAEAIIKARENYLLETNLQGKNKPSQQQLDFDQLALEYKAGNRTLLELENAFKATELSYKSPIEQARLVQELNSQRLLLEARMQAAINNPKAQTDEIINIGKELERVNDLYSKSNSLVSSFDATRDTVSSITDLHRANIALDNLTHEISKLETNNDKTGLDDLRKTHDILVNKVNNFEQKVNQDFNKSIVGRTANMIDAIFGGNTPKTISNFVDNVSKRTAEDRLMSRVVVRHLITNIDEAREIIANTEGASIKVINGKNYLEYSGSKTLEGVTTQWEITGGDIWNQPKISKVTETITRLEQALKKDLRGVEAGVKVQSQMLVEALLGNTSKLYRAAVGLGKTEVVLPILSIGKAQITHKSVLTLFPSSGKIDEFLDSLIKRKLGDKPTESDILEVESLLKTKLGHDIVILTGDFESRLKNAPANTVLLSSPDVIFNQIADSSSAKALIARIKGGVLIADEAHRTLLANTDYIISRGNNLQLAGTEYEKTFFKAWNQLKDLEPDFIREYYQLEKDEYGRFVAKNKEGLQQLARDLGNDSEAFAAAKSILDTLGKRQGLDIGLDANGRPALKAGNEFTGRQPSDPYDAFSLEVAGRKVLADNSPPQLDQVGISRESLGTNYGLFLREFSEIIGFTGTPEQVTNQFNLIYGIALKSANRSFESANIQPTLNRLVGKSIIRSSSLEELAKAEIVGQIAHEVLATEIVTNDYLSLRLKNVTDRNVVVVRFADGHSERYTNNGSEFTRETNISKDQVNESLKSGQKVLQIYEFGAHFGTDAETKVGHKLRIVLSDKSTLTDFNQAVGRGRSGLEDLEIAWLGADPPADYLAMETVLRTQESIAIRQGDLAAIKKSIENIVPETLKSMRLADLANFAARDQFIADSINKYYDGLLIKYRASNGSDSTIETTKISARQDVADSLNRAYLFLSQVDKSTVVRPGAKKILSKTLGGFSGASGESLAKITGNPERFLNSFDNINQLSKETAKILNKTDLYGTQDLALGDMEITRGKSAQLAKTTSDTQVDLPNAPPPSTTGRTGASSQELASSPTLRQRLSTVPFIGGFFAPTPITPTITAQLMTSIDHSQHNELVQKLTSLTDGERNELIESLLGTEAANAFKEIILESQNRNLMRDPKSTEIAVSRALTNAEKTRFGHAVGEPISGEEGIKSYAGVGDMYVLYQNTDGSISRASRLNDAQKNALRDYFIGKSLFDSQSQSLDNFLNKQNPSEIAKILSDLGYSDRQIQIGRLPVVPTGASSQELASSPTLRQRLSTVPFIGGFFAPTPITTPVTGDRTLPLQETGVIPKTPQSLFGEVVNEIKTYLTTGQNSWTVAGNNLLKQIESSRVVEILANVTLGPTKFLGEKLAEGLSAIGNLVTKKPIIPDDSGNNITVDTSTQGLGHEIQATINDSLAIQYYPSEQERTVLKEELIKQGVIDSTRQEELASNLIFYKKTTISKNNISETSGLSFNNLRNPELGEIWKKYKNKEIDFKTFIEAVSKISVKKISTDYWSLHDERYIERLANLEQQNPNVSSQALTKKAVICLAASNEVSLETVYDAVSKSLSDSGDSIDNYLFVIYHNYKTPREAVDKDVIESVERMKSKKSVVIFEEQVPQNNNVRYAKKVLADLSMKIIGDDSDMPMIFIDADILDMSSGLITKAIHKLNNKLAITTNYTRSMAIDNTLPALKVYFELDEYVYRESSKNQDFTPNTLGGFTVTQKRTFQIVGGWIPYPYSAPEDISYTSQLNYNLNFYGENDWSVGTLTEPSDMLVVSPDREVADYLKGLPENNRYKNNNYDSISGSKRSFASLSTVKIGLNQSISDHDTIQGVNDFIKVKLINRDLQGMFGKLLPHPVTYQAIANYLKSKGISEFFITVKDGENTKTIKSNQDPTNLIVLGVSLTDPNAQIQPEPIRLQTTILKSGQSNGNIEVLNIRTTGTPDADIEIDGILISEVKANSSLRIGRHKVNIMSITENGVTISYDYDSPLSETPPSTTVNRFGEEEDFVEIANHKQELESLTYKVTRNANDTISIFGYKGDKLVVVGQRVDSGEERSAVRFTYRVGNTKKTWVSYFPNNVFQEDSVSHGTEPYVEAFSKDLTLVMLSPNGLPYTSLPGAYRYLNIIKNPTLVHPSIFIADLWKSISTFREKQFLAKLSDFNQNEIDPVRNSVLALWDKPQKGKFSIPYPTRQGLKWITVERIEGVKFEETAIASKRPILSEQKTPTQPTTPVIGDSDRTLALQDAGRKVRAFVRNGILVAKALVTGFDAQSIEALTGKKEGQPGREGELLDRAPLTPELLSADYDFIVIKISDTSYFTFKKVNGKWILTPLATQKGLNILAQVQNWFTKKPTQPIQTPTTPVTENKKQDIGYEALLTRYPALKNIDRFVSRALFGWSLSDVRDLIVDAMNFADEQIQDRPAIIGNPFTKKPTVTPPQLAQAQVPATKTQPQTQRSPREVEALYKEQFGELPDYITTYVQAVKYYMLKANWNRKPFDFTDTQAEKDAWAEINTSFAIISALTPEATIKFMEDTHNGSVLTVDYLNTLMITYSNNLELKTAIEILLKYWNPNYQTSIPASNIVTDIPFTQSAKTSKGNPTATKYPDNQDTVTEDGILADGAGGHMGGKFASSNISSLFAEELSKLDNLTAKLIAGAIFRARERYTKLARHFDQHARTNNPNMASTVEKDAATTLNAVIPATDNNVFVVNVGDSPTWLIRNGKLVPLTLEQDVPGIQKLLGLETENSKGNEIVGYISATTTSDDWNESKFGSPQQLTDAWNKKFPDHKSVFVYARKNNESRASMVQVTTVKSQPGDIIIQASDGLTQVLTETEILRIVASGGTSDQITNKLMQAALAKDSDISGKKLARQGVNSEGERVNIKSGDNISVITTVFDKGNQIQNTRNKIGEFLNSIKSKVQSWFSKSPVIQVASNPDIAPKIESNITRKAKNLIKSVYSGLKSGISRAITTRISWLDLFESLDSRIGRMVEHLYLNTESIETSFEFTNLSASVMPFLKNFIGNDSMVQIIQNISEIDKNQLDLFLKNNPDILTIPNINRPEIKSVLDLKNRLDRIVSNYKDDVLRGTALPADQMVNIRKWRLQLYESVIPASKSRILVSINNILGLTTLNESETTIEKIHHKKLNVNDVTTNITHRITQTIFGSINRRSANVTADSSMHMAQDSNNNRVIAGRYKLTITADGVSNNKDEQGHPIRLRSKEVADEIAHNDIVNNIANYLVKKGMTPHEAIQQAIKDMLQNIKAEDIQDGSAITSISIFDISSGKLYTGNIGDSPIILVNKVTGEIKWISSWMNDNDRIDFIKALQANAERLNRNLHISDLDVQKTTLKDDDNDTYHLFQRVKRGQPGSVHPISIDTTPEDIENTLHLNVVDVPSGWTIINTTDGFEKVFESEIEIKTDRTIRATGKLLEAIRSDNPIKHILEHNGDKIGEDDMAITIIDFEKTTSKPNNKINWFYLQSILNPPTAITVQVEEPRTIESVKAELANSAKYRLDQATGRIKVLVDHLLGHEYHGTKTTSIVSPSHVETVVTLATEVVTEDLLREFGVLEAARKLGITGTDTEVARIVLEAHRIAAWLHENANFGSEDGSFYPRQKFAGVEAVAAKQNIDSLTNDPQIKTLVPLLIEGTDFVKYYKDGAPDIASALNIADLLSSITYMTDNPRLEAGNLLFGESYPNMANGMNPRWFHFLHDLINGDNPNPTQQRARIFARKYLDQYMANKYPTNWPGLDKWLDLLERRATFLDTQMDIANTWNNPEAYYAKLMALSDKYPDNLLLSYQTLDTSNLINPAVVQTIELLSTDHGFITDSHKIDTIIDKALAAKAREALEYEIQLRIAKELNGHIIKNTLVDQMVVEITKNLETLKNISWLLTDPNIIWTHKLHYWVNVANQYTYLSHLFTNDNNRMNLLNNKVKQGRSQEEIRKVISDRLNIDDSKINEFVTNRILQDFIQNRYTYLVNLVKAMVDGLKNEVGYENRLAALSNLLNSDLSDKFITTGTLKDVYDKLARLPKRQGVDTKQEQEDAAAASVVNPPTKPKVEKQARTSLGQKLANIFIGTKLRRMVLITVTSITLAATIAYSVGINQSTLPTNSVPIITSTVAPPEKVVQSTPQPNVVTPDSKPVITSAKPNKTEKASIIKSAETRFQSFVDNKCMNPIEVNQNGKTIYTLDYVTPTPEQCKDLVLYSDLSDPKLFNPLTNRVNTITTLEGISPFDMLSQVNATCTLFNFFMIINRQNAFTYNGKPLYINPMAFMEILGIDRATYDKEVDYFLKDPAIIDTYVDTNPALAKKLKDNPDQVYNIIKQNPKETKTLQAASRAGAVTSLVFANREAKAKFSDLLIALGLNSTPDGFWNGIEINKENGSVFIYDSNIKPDEKSLFAKYGKTNIQVQGNKIEGVRIPKSDVNSVLGQKLIKNVQEFQRDGYTYLLGMQADSSGVAHVYQLYETVSVNSFGTANITVSGSSGLTTSTSNSKNGIWNKLKPNTLYIHAVETHAGDKSGPSTWGYYGNKIIEDVDGSIWIPVNEIFGWNPVAAYKIKKMADWNTESISLVSNAPKLTEFSQTLGTIINQYEANSDGKELPSVYITRELGKTQFKNVLNAPKFKNALKFVDDNTNLKPGEKVQCMGWAELLEASGYGTGVSISGKPGHAIDLLPKASLNGVKVVDAGSRVKAIRIDDIGEIDPGDIVVLTNTKEGHVFKVLEIKKGPTEKKFTISEGNKNNDGKITTYDIGEREFENKTGKLGKEVFVLRPYSADEVKQASFFP